MNIDKDRLKTGAILIGAIILIAVFDSFFITWAFLGVAFIIAFYESMKLFSLSDNSLYFYAVALWVIAFLYQNPDDLIFLVLIGYVSHMLYTQSVDLKKFYPFIYPTSSFLFLLALYKGFGMEALIWLVIVVALTDTGAYFVGRSFGKRQFCAISPKKTWEGVIGGVLLASIVGAIYGAGFVSGFLAFVISALVSASSIFGDLYESYLKRSVGVKDSGKILPGHGGVLDRVDGFMFGSVVMVILLRGLA